MSRKMVRGIQFEEKGAPCARTHERSDTVTRKEKWLAARRKAITGTDLAAILGLSQWKSAYQVWAEKVHGYTDVEETEAMYWGKALEHLVAEEYGNRTGNPISRQDHYNFVPHPSAPLGVTLDYTTVNNELPAVLEIKTASQYSLSDWQDRPPVHAWVQLQAQMECTGVEQGILAVLVGGSTFLWHHVDKELGFCQQALAYCVHWWDKYVFNCQQPPTDDNPATGRILEKLYPAENYAKTLPKDTQIELDTLEYHKEQKKQAEKNIRIIENELKSALGNASYGIIEGDNRVISWRETERKAYEVPAKKYRVLRTLKKLPKGVKMEGENE
jgi:putative phage-type endonuclease